MKKLFTLIAAALMAVGANAQKTNLSLAAGWDTSIEVDLTGDVEFNFKNSYACIYMDITEVDLATYPSYEIVVSEDTPVTNLQLYVKSDAGENWSGSFSAGTTVCSFVPETATKIFAIGLQACNVADLGKVEIVSASLIDKDGNKKALSYKMPESWAADVVTPVTKGNIAFTSGGQWTAANLKGGEGMALPVKITFNADEFPANVQLQIITSKADETTYSKNREVSSELTAGEKTHTVTIEALEEGETIKSIAVQNKEKQDPFKIMNVTATIEPAGGDEPAATSSKIIFSKEDGTADAIKTEYNVNGFKMTYVDTNNKAAVDANSQYFGTAEAYENYKARFKTGAKSDSKSNITLTIPATGTLKIAVRSASGSATDRNLVLTQSGTELYNQIVKDADAVSVNIEGEDKKVFPYVTVEVAAGTVEVTYPGGALNFYAFELLTSTGIQQTIAPAKVIENNVIYNLAGQKVNESYKGIVIKNGKKYIQK
jgi:hypothetical protein